MYKNETISVCICTYKRAELLKHAIVGILSLSLIEQLMIEIVVIDNDNNRSAESVVKNIENNSQIKIIYDCEPEKNIALARNRAVINANGNYITFIDDDEVPLKDWLQNLYHTLKATGADGVLGPVLPSFPAEAPKWLNKCHLFDRRRFRTGTILTESRDTRTGNVLLSRNLFPDGEFWFDPAFGLTGGEDVDFFSRKLAESKKFVWCDEAVAYETILPERWKGSYYIKRYFRGGTINSERLSKNRIMAFKNLFKSVIGVMLWSFIFIVSLPFGKHNWFRPVLKLSYFTGGILAFFGFSFFRDR